MGLYHHHRCWLRPFDAGAGQSGYPAAVYPADPTRRSDPLRYGGKTQEKLAGLNNLILETLQISGITLVKLFNQEKDQAERFHEFNQDVTKLEIQESLAGRWFFMVAEVRWRLWDRWCCIW